MLRRPEACLAFALAMTFAIVLSPNPAPAEPLAPVETAALPQAAGDATGNGGFRLTYDVYKSGLRALSLDFDVTLADGSYRTDVRLETAGVVGWLFDWRLEANSAGRWRDGMFVPERHLSANTWRGRQRRVEIGYDAGVPAEVNAEPPYSEDARRRVAPELLPGALDPMSAITAMILANATGPLCRPRTAIYDGRRRYDAELTPLGTTELRASNYAAYAGMAEGCLLEFERIAGFKKDRESLHDATAKIWLADIGTGAGKVPVRLELDTPWGTGFAHLARARRADGVLVFGSED